MRVVGQISWVIMTLFALFLFSITVPYWSFRSNINFLLVKQAVVHYIPWRTAFYIHILGGMLAISIGPFQFVKALRRKFMSAHRLMGKIYVTAILCLAAPTGLYMALFAQGGLWGSIGFVIMSLLWFTTTYLAYKRIREYDVIAHQKWMIRSYAVTFSAVTLRLWVPILSIYTNIDHDFIIIITAWISWFFNLLFAETIIALTLNSKTLKPQTP